LSETAAEVMTLGQHDRTREALELFRAGVASAGSADPLGLAGLWYAACTVHYYADDYPALVAAADQCITLARDAGASGWVSNALSMRAMAHLRTQQLDAALADLAHAEVELDACQDAALACWAHTGLGASYCELRLYELAEPHYESALLIDESPVPLAEAPVIDLMNLAELYQRWAEEIERALPTEDADDEADDLRAKGHHYAVLAVARARRMGAPMLASCEALELCTRPREDAERSLPELRTAYAASGHTEQRGSRVLIGGALARALWRTGRREEALTIARSSAAASVHAGDWQVEASARWLLAEMEVQADLPGARSGRDYARFLSRVLWRQRLSTLAGAQATLAAERLDRDHAAARKAAREDSLTGVGNRRALDDALAEVARDQRRTDERTSMLLVDLDEFKTFNDRYGHAFGDGVLRTVAHTLQRVARSEDLVVRLGGDEFVVLALDTDEAGASGLAERVGDALGRIVLETPDGPRGVTASVGVRTTGGGLDLHGLMHAADEAMYAAKRGDPPSVQPAPA
jgi:diguanylate cyclase (GGDEF)-like protein